MKKFLPIFFTIILIAVSLFYLVTPNHADLICPPTCNDSGDGCMSQIEQCKNNLTQALNQSLNATHPLESQLASMQQQILGIKNRVVFIQQDVAVKQQQIDAGYKDLNAKKELLNHAIRNFYIKSSYNSPILIFMSGKTASEITQILQYQKVAADEDKQIITNIAITIADLQQKQQALESEKVRLAAIKADLDDQSAKLDKVIAGAHAYQATLGSQIADLSAKQQSLLAAKLGSLNIPLFAISGGGCSSDLNPYKDPGFGGTKFGLFSYGVPNRVGLNQYGAFGRAKSGQSSDTILRAYYNFDGYQNFSGITIRVNDSNGFNSGNIIWSGSLEDYMQRIYEVPNEWGDQGGMEALKAQAIAARSYVLASTNNGSASICANQNCQVFQTGAKGGNWANAVSQTSGQAMIQGGQPIKGWFSSTHGGYIFSSSDIGWSSTSFTKHAQDASGPITSWASLNSNAYDKDSPWFYCDWGSVHNGTAWLSSSEMADIVNSILLVQNDSSADPHILQPDKPDPEMWSPDQVRSALSKYRTPFSSMSGGSVDADFGIGKSTMVHMQGDQGNFDVDSNTFRKYFNLRAPAKVQIVGYLYNLEVHQ